MMKKNGKKINAVLLAIMLAAFYLPPIGAAQDSYADSMDDATFSNETMPSQTPAFEGEEKPEVKVERTPDGKYFLDFKAASLINVLNVLSSLSGINFVAGAEVSNRQVNLTLDDVTLDDVLLAISLGCNVTYDAIPGRDIFVFRASADAPEQAPLMTRVFKFYYIRVSKMREIEAEASSSGESSGLTTLQQDEEDLDVEGSAVYKIVEKMLSERGKVSVDDRSNSIVVTDIESRLNMVEDAVRQLDKPLDQVLINVFLIETYEDMNRAVGVTWGDANGNFGTLTGAIQDTNWPFFNGPVADSGTSFWSVMENMYKNTAKQFNPAHDSNGAAYSTVGTRDFSAFQVTLQAMEDASKVKILAKPKILVLDNHPALIKIATNAAIGTNTVTTGGGSGTTSESIERAEVGTILRVTPLINQNDQITMTVEPTFATVQDSTITLADPTGDTTTRQARTTLMVNDGQTIALGGLLFSDQTKDDRKVPFFGNIPLIGKALFTSSGKQIEDRELILFLTPFIIRDPSVLETLKVPDGRMHFDEETAPFWKVKKKQNFKNLTQEPEKRIDYEQYFDVRKRVMEASLDTIGQKT